MNRPSRRGVLRGLLGGSAVAVGLPWLETLVRPAHASEGLFPQRFGLFLWGNGNLPPKWNPTTEGPGFPLSEQLAPLVGLESYLTCISGMSVKVPNVIPHFSGSAGFLAGGPTTGGLDNDNWTMIGPSIDQAIAQEIGGDTIYRSLEIGVGSTYSLSHNGPFSTNPCENDPYAFYERIFGANFTGGGDGTVPPSLGYRRSVLDVVMNDIAALNPKLSSHDQARLDQHLTGIRELELRLARLQEDPPDLDACVQPDSPTADYSDINGRPQIAAKAQILADLMAMALACDQTRVFSLQMHKPLSNILYPNATDGHHNLTHDEPGDQPMVNDIVIHVMEQYAYLCNALKNIPEGDETLLDHCAVMATSDVSEGRTHSLDDLPIVYCGSACGALVTGTHYRSYSQETAGKVMLSLLRAFGILAPSWGVDDVYTTDGLSAMEV